MRMVAGGGMIYARWVFRRAGIRSPGRQIVLSLVNYHSLLFARSDVVRSGFVQGMMWRGVSWNPRTWVVVTQVMGWIVDLSLFAVIQKR
jgi:hypothetical protein